MTRFEPTRAGIINMWDYRDEEFCFAGGWLVLRGPNGSGKTKALEVLFPFVLDGRIDPKRLNPFAAEDRTMKSNLLYRGGENAVGYAWLEFRHAGTGEAVTVGIGLHAQRHRDTPIRWHFVADGRVGEDFSLITDDDRPMTRKQLAEEIGEAALFGSPTEHRAAIDQRLFGLGAERYEQLLTLILTLRRPQLAKNLDPVKLSDTLTDGLRPVDDDLIAEAARSFDDMEAVAVTLEGLAAADEATQTFLASYTGGISPTSVRAGPRVNRGACRCMTEIAAQTRLPGRTWSEVAIHGDCHRPKVWSGVVNVASPETAGPEEGAPADAFGIDAFTLDDRLRLFGFAAAEKRHEYLWLLRAFDRARANYQVLMHASDARAMLDAARRRACRRRARSATCRCFSTRWPNGRCWTAPTTAPAPPTSPSTATGTTSISSPRRGTAPTARWRTCSAPASRTRNCPGWSSRTSWPTWSRSRRPREPATPRRCTGSCPGWTGCWRTWPSAPPGST